MEGTVSVKGIHCCQAPDGPDVHRDVHTGKTRPIRDRELEMSQSAVCDPQLYVVISEILGRLIRDYDLEAAKAFHTFFTEDAVYRGLDGTVLTGRDEIAGYFSERDLGTTKVRHIVSNLSVSWADGELAAYSLMTVFGDQGAASVNPMLVADCHDRFAHTQAGWLLKSRTISLALGALSTDLPAAWSAGFAFGVRQPASRRPKEATGDRGEDEPGGVRVARACCYLPKVESGRDDRYGIGDR